MISVRKNPYEIKTGALFMVIKVERTAKQLSANAGLLLFKELVDRVGLEVFLKDCVPHLKLGPAKNIKKIKQLVLAFQAGADCLDDLDRLAEDEGFKQLCGGKVYSPKAFGDFLRGFTRLHCREFNNKLIDLSFLLRRELFGKTQSFTIDIDSTTNEQHGDKMEGVCYNYAGVKGLDTICAFDEYGLQYYSDVRPGNTHTAQGALESIHQIFNRMPKDMDEVTRYVRADSGYCKIAFLNACAAKRAQFVVCMRKLMYKPLIGSVQNWQAQDPNDKSRIIFKDGRECEVGETVYRSKNSPFDMRVVIIRAVKVGREEQLVKGEEDYDYYGWVTNMSSDVPAVDVIKFYRKRGHAENFIRELKNGLDLAHYPCQKLLANKAYSLIAALAYNFMRFVALKDDDKHPKFAKAIRFHFIHLPCEVIRHAGQVVFRFMDQHIGEVNYWLKYIKNIKLGFA